MTDPGFETDTFIHANGASCPTTKDASLITLEVPIEKPPGWVVSCSACGQQLVQNPS